MEIRRLEINERPLWLVIDQFRVYVEANNSFVTTERFICYYKLKEPNTLFFGELIKDENDLPILFNSADEAEEYVTHQFRNNTLP